MLDCKRTLNAFSAIALIGALPWLGTAALGQTTAPSFVAPPRTIDDITAILDQEKPDPNITRGEALRAAMMALLDGQGFADDKGNVLFTYGHPLFWAPYTIIGDGGGARESK
jgi:hypothetical protein